MSEGKVIFLAFRNPELPSDTVENLTCGTCRNKTWLAVYEEKGNGFPRLKCACCGMDGGHFGWVNEEEIKS